MAATHRFQAPKGTRDFGPAEMAVRNHVERMWCDTAVCHGFEQIDGPTFEHLDLYTVKSGPGIVSELFSFRRADGDVDYALRPEFTPTLARMVAANAHALPKPTKWFSIASMFRAERPQRGRLREHIQWNVDVIGDAEPRADAEVVAVAAAFLERAGFTPETVRIRMSHRTVVADALRAGGVSEEQLPAAFELLDRRDKLPAEAFVARAAELGIDAGTLDRFAHGQAVALEDTDFGALPGPGADAFAALAEQLRAVNLDRWCAVDFGIVRGLAYYTGTVFEVHEMTGRERAIAGGGRYDGLVELFGGPPTPAVGFAMGDVVLSLVMQDHGLLEEASAYLPRPHAFVIAASDAGADALPRIVAGLRRAGLHARHSYRSTRNVGKLLGEAGRCRARSAVIVGDGIADGIIALKDLDSGEQRDVALAQLEEELRCAP